MKIKKIVALTAACAMLSSTAGCQIITIDGEGTAEVGENGVVGNGAIGLSVSTLNNPFFVSLAEGAQAEAEEKGAELITVDAGDDAAKQTNDVEDLISRNVSVLIVNPVDSDAVAPAVKDAISKGIKVISVDRVVNGVDVDCQIASDNVAGAKMATEYLVETIGEGTPVAELQGTTGASATIDRGAGFHEVADEKLDVTGSQTADFNRATGMTVMENLLQANGSIKGVFAHNDEMALGALEAIAATGKDIKVKVSTMPDVSKLTLAIAADQTPDVALGLMSYVPFDLSSRGALYDLTKFDDFWTVARRFPTGSFVSYVYNEGMYAIPETTDFNAIVYRTDIFKNLGLKVPNTWDDLIEILPTLQRYGMNFYHNISLGTTGYKWFYQTAPMILQNGGELYTQDDNGLITTGIDSKKSVKGLQLLGDLFTKYSLDTSVQTFFNSFRYSVLPIGIVGMEDYTLIKNGAKELDGKWAISQYLGTKQEDGTVNRTFVANGTGGAIFNSSDKKQEAWEFLKWWTSKSVQTEYTYTLRSSYGKTFFWLSANRAALENNPMDEADKKIITEQINYVTDVTRTPGQYLLERTISNIWTTMVFDGTAGQVAVDEAKNDVNKEIVRKMKELGYYDENGKMVKKFKLQGYDWIKENQDKAKADPGEEVSSNE